MTKYSDHPLKSATLTALEEDRDKLKAKSKQSQAAVLRLSKILSPQSLDVTVTRVDDLRKEAATAKAVAATGVISEQEEAARKADELQRTLNGESLADAASTREKFEREQRQWAAYESAIEFRTREIERAKTALAIEYCKTLKPTYDALMKRFCRPMLEAHAILLELHELKQHLIDTQAGLRGICLNLPDFLSAPNNQYSELADWFRAMKREGYINAIPKEFKL